MNIPIALRSLIVGFFYCFHASATHAPEFFKKRSEIKPNHYLITSVGGGHIAYKDQISSQRGFSGPALGLFESYERHSEKKLVVWDAFSQFGLQGNGLEGWNQTFSTAFNFRTNFAWMYYLPLSSKLNYYFGPAIQHYSMYRLNPSHGNAALAYDVSTNLGVRGRIECPIPIKTKKTYDFWIFSVKKMETRKLRMGMEVDLPMFGFQSRPPYTGAFDVVGNDPAAELLENFFANTKLATINRFFFLNTQTYLRFPLANGNALQLSYFWQAYRYNYQGQQVRTAAGATMFSFIFRFDANKDIR
ncbi:MAG: hypothetical protein ACK417_05325 [Bacteroidia bacterium]